MVMLVLSISTIDYHQQIHNGHLQRLLHQWPQPPPLRRVARRWRFGDIGDVADIGDAALRFLLDALILRGRFSKRQLLETVVLMMELGSPDLCQNLKQSEDLHEKRGYVYIIVYVYV